MDLQDQGVIDRGCSRHMTGNMSYLTDYEEIDGGYVAFGGNPKGGKITRKCKIKTGNLDFENVYFLIDESQVLLRVPRKNNTYSVDLKNIVPKGGLTCLFAKATSDESKLWHRRLGSGPDWLFDIDALTRTMNYEPIIAGTQSNGFAGTKASDNAGQARKETKLSSHDDGSKPSSDDGKKVDEDPRKDSECKDQEEEDNVNSTNNVNTASNVNVVSSTVNADGTNEVNVVGGKTSIELQFDPNMTALEDDSIFDVTRDDEDDGVVADMNNLDTTNQVSPNPTTRIHKDHPLDQVIGDLQSATQTRNMSKNLEEHRFVSTASYNFILLSFYY
ncbi:hypothetical protein Tco_0967127 [Tanacetum coccineum]